jgi:hypothetical protein
MNARSPPTEDPGTSALTVIAWRSPMTERRTISRGRPSVVPVELCGRSFGVYAVAVSVGRGGMRTSLPVWLFDKKSS